MEPRLRALADLSVPEFREYGGRHEYDGQVQDLSPAGVARGLAALGNGERRADPYDEAVLSAFEDSARVVYGELEFHRINPLVHVGNLDVACYDREYAPAAERAEARRRHLARWPDAVDGAIASLDRVARPVAESTRSAVRGLAAGLDDSDEVDKGALAALDRLVDHVERAAVEGPQDAALGGPALARYLGSGEALDVDLGTLAGTADRERDRLTAMLTEACEQVAPGRPVATTVAALLRDHPDADGVLREAREVTAEVLAWTKERDLAPYHDGECRVGPAPPSRRWAMAMMSWAAPGEPEGPSWYYVTPPDESWPAEEQQEWLAVFSRTTLPAITVHEVAPGHFSHGRALRHAASDVRQLLISGSFAEGWAHYVEEVAMEEGFRAADPRFAAGVAIEALIRVTRLACSIGLHTGAMTVADAAARFAADAFLQGPAALSEAQRGTFDPGYGRYTWGKLAVTALREQARAAWGEGFSLPRFHRAMLDLGSPPLGLLATAVERG
ncbi:MAG: DUF885 domain-containing protein [Pseudonocardiales bacterium]|nr:MAG: DUF885 domain-containing protein [Pseudonocardiales bacterium]